MQAAQIVRDQHVQTAAVERDKAVALADRQKQIAVAEQEAARARAEAAVLRAAAEREQAGQQVQSVVQLAEAEREANKKLIAARQEIEQEKLKLQTAADVDAYTRTKQAEGDRDAAQKQAEARLQLAEAEAQAKELVARGEKAQQMVAVEVAREQVGVEGAKVAVERQQLENRQEFAEAGIQLEVRKLSIQAGRDVQVEFAKALASFLTNGHMTLYGTPETASAMLDKMASGFGVRSMIEGFLRGPGGSGELLGAPAGGGRGDGLSGLLGDIGELLRPALAEVTGGDGAKLTPQLGEQVARGLADNPAFLNMLREALAAGEAGPARRADPVGAGPGAAERSLAAAPALPSAVAVSKPPAYTPASAGPGAVKPAQK